MAKTGYVVFTVKAKVRSRRGDEWLPLDDVTGNGHELLHAAGEVADHYAGLGVQRDKRFEQAWLLEAWDGQGRSLFLKGSAGPYGVSGRLVDVDTSEQASFDDRKATMVDLRALLVVPPGGVHGLLFCERRGGRHLKAVVDDALLRHVERHHRLTISVQPHIDRAAWARFVDEGEAFEVTSVYRPTNLEDGVEIRKQAELRVTATGRLAERVGGVLRHDLGAWARGERDRAPVNLRQLRPAQEDGYAHHRTELTIADGEGAKRKVVVERGELPQWVYELEGRLGDSALLDTWQGHAVALASDYASSLPDGWASGRWPAEVTQQGVVPG